MKTLFRILTILLIAVLIGSAVYVLVGGGTSSNLQPAIRTDRPALPNGDFRPEGRGREGGGGLPFEMVKTLAIMAVITVFYTNTGKLFGKKKITQAI